MRRRRRVPLTLTSGLARLSARPSTSFHPSESPTLTSRKAHTMTCTLDVCADFDSDFNPADRMRILNRIAAFARAHDGIRARVTRAGTVLLTDRDGAIRSVTSMTSAAHWLGY